jgi:hypothetical protein
MTIIGRCPCYIMKLGLLAALLLGCVLALRSQPVAADPTSTCPDGMVLAPASLVQQGAQKDHNQNGFVCAKLENGQLVGGPDDVSDDIIL